MATRKVKLSGIAEWAKVFTQNRDMEGFDGVYRDHGGACTIDVIMDEDSLTALKASRSMKKGSPDPQGRGTKVKFIRKYDTGRDWSTSNTCKAGIVGCVCGCCDNDAWCCLQYGWYDPCTTGAGSNDDCRNWSFACVSTSCT